MIGAIVFDAFGTVARICHRTNPYRKLVREGRRQGLHLTLETTHLAMTTNLPFDMLAVQLGISLSPSKRKELNLAFEVELSSIRPFEDAIEAIALLRQAGLKIGICSNLAQPYGPIIKRLFPELDGYAFSFELGCLKPDPDIYQSVCNQMSVQSGTALTTT